jgi:hypothetical protein
MKKNLTEIKLKVLTKIADYEGTEWGEEIASLLHLYKRRHEHSEKFWNALCDELDGHYDFFQKNYTFEEVIEEEIITTSYFEIISKAN